MDERDLVSGVRTACSSSAAAVRRTLRNVVSVLVLALAILAGVGPSVATAQPAEDIFAVVLAAQVGNAFVPAVVQVDATNGSQTVIASGGKLVIPSDIALAANGDLLVADRVSGIIQVNRLNGSQTIVSSGGIFGTPAGLAIGANGTLFVADPTCCAGLGGVIQVDPTTGNQTIVSLGANFVSPSGIGVAPNGDLYVADKHGAVIMVNPLGSPNSNQTVVSSGKNFVSPIGIAISSNGDFLLVTDEACCDNGSGGIIKVLLPGGGQSIVTQGGNFARPQRMGLNALGDFLVADSACCTGNNGGFIESSDGSQTILSQGGAPLGIAVGFVQSRPPNACGGTVPCACGDLVVRDRTLRGSDPVTRTVCPADGLVVADGVTLDLGGATLRGQGAGAGVRIEAGATNATVRRGKITGFATGVRGEGTIGAHLTGLQIFDHARDGVILSGDGHRVEQSLIQGNGGLGVVVLGNASRLASLQVRNNARAGVRLVGNGNTLEQSAIAGNGAHGAEVSGDGNQVAQLRVERNRGDGVFLTGSGNTAARNSALGNGGDGLEIRGARATVDGNRATSHGEAGLEIHGTGHRVSRNIAGLNAGTGLEMVGTTESAFNGNRGENNSAFGIADDSTGGGTGGTANTYSGNLCGRGNGAGASSPGGLCR